MALTLYHVAWCPDCEVVRQKLADLHIEYEHVVVPDVRPMRKVVHESQANTMFLSSKMGTWY